MIKYSALGMAPSPGGGDRSHIVADSEMPDNENTSPLPNLNNIVNNNNINQHQLSTNHVTQNNGALFNVTKNMYSNAYHVYIESTDEKNIGRLHPMMVGHI